MIKFLHAADIHLDSPMLNLEFYEGAPREALRGATRWALENLVDLAGEEKVDFLLISGDIYDGDWKDYNTGLFFLSLISRLKDANIPVYLISGNHDAASRMTKSLRLPKGVNRFSPGKAETFHLDNLGVAIHGQSFARPGETGNMATGYPKALQGYFNIGMLHTCATGREGHESYAPCSKDDLLAKGYQYWALGHIHKKEIISRDPLVLFPGNLQGRNIRERGPKGAALVTVKDSGEVDFEFCPLDVFRWDYLHIDTRSLDIFDIMGLVAERVAKRSGQEEGLPLALRLAVKTDSSLTDELISSRERWINEIRSSATDLSNGNVWVEKVLFRPGESREESSHDILRGPLLEIQKLLEEMKDTKVLLEALEDPLAKLKKKLPWELMEGGDNRDPEDAAWLLEILGDVGPMLMNRLKSGGDK